MLDSVLIIRMKSVGQSITTDAEAFVAVMANAVEALGGKQWKKSDLPSLFQDLYKECRHALCIADDGPRIDNGLFGQYFRAARNALVFDVPFRIAKRIPTSDLMELLSLVEADTRPCTREQKLRDAVVLLRAKRRPEPTPINSVHIPLPTPDDGDEWVMVLYNSLNRLLCLPEVERLKDGAHGFELRELAALASKMATPHSLAPIAERAEPCAW
jgi:hypothetical protein